MGTDWFFGYYVDPISLGGKALTLLLAVILGGVIGLERQWHGNAAGMRTHILVCVGATIITISSVEIGLGVRGGMRGDPGHIAAQIVSGIGFLGAGAILREGVTVRGLTTAASVWATAGIGIALGASPRLAELAVLAAGIVLITLTILGRLEEALNVKQSIQMLEVEVYEADRGPARLIDLLCTYGIVIYGIQSEAGPTSLSKTALGTTRLMHMRIQLPRSFDRNAFNKLLTEQKDIVAFHLE